MIIKYYTLIYLCGYVHDSQKKGNSQKNYPAKIGVQGKRVRYNCFKVRKIHYYWSIIYCAIITFSFFNNLLFLFYLLATVNKLIQQY